MPGRSILLIALNGMAQRFDRAVCITLLIEFDSVIAICGG